MLESKTMTSLNAADIDDSLNFVCWIKKVDKVTINSGSEHKEEWRYPPLWLGKSTVHLIWCRARPFP